MTPDEPANPTDWIELVFDVDREVADGLSDALLEHGAMSVQVLDGQAGTAAEQPVFGEPGLPAAPIGWAVSRLVLLAPDEAGARQLLRDATAAIGMPEPGSVGVRTVGAQDWVSLTQAQFEPMAIGQRLWITPSWHSERRFDGQREVILLDPGMAFGTGSHPTTRLCLSWLDAHLTAGQSVIDYGCGSGILAIAAAKLGAASVHGIDIDEQAITCARANASANDVAIHWSTSRQTLPPTADVVVANILASPLKVLAPLLEDRVGPGGWLLLAGLLDSQVDEVAACYARIPMHSVASDDGWSLLAGRREMAPMV